MLEILTPIWHVKSALAGNVRWRIRAVLEWAVAMELRTDNPCDRLGSVLGCWVPSITSCSTCGPCRMAYVAGAIERVRASEAEPVVKLAFEFLVPPCGSAINILDAARTLREKTSPFVFP